MPKGITPRQVCTLCEKLRPLSQYDPPDPQCRTCRSDKQREKRQRAREEAARPDPPVKQFTPRPTVSRSEGSVSPPAFDDRVSLETYIKGEMARNLQKYDAIIDSAERMLVWAEENGSIKEAVKQQGVIRQTLKDKQAMIAGLTKQFELLASLDRPMSEDPKYTPVTLILETEPPPRAYVDKPHYLDADDIQDGQDIS